MNKLILFLGVLMLTSCTIELDSPITRVDTLSTNGEIYACEYAVSGGTFEAPCDLFKIGDVPLDFIQGDVVTRHYENKLLEAKKDSIKTDLMITIDSLLNQMENE